MILKTKRNIKNNRETCITTNVIWYVPYYKKLPNQEINAVCLSTALILRRVKFVYALIKWYINFVTVLVSWTLFCAKIVKKSQPQSRSISNSWKRFSGVIFFEFRSFYWIRQIKHSENACCSFTKLNAPENLKNHPNYEILL